MTKKQEILKRQKKLVDFIKGWRGKMLLGDEELTERLGYSSKRTLAHDLNILRKKFVLYSKLNWIDGVKSTREIRVTDNGKDLRNQSDSAYLEALALANPDSFRVEWNEGYDEMTGGVRKYIEEKTRGAKCTGVYMLKEPSDLLSKRPIATPFVESLSNENTYIYDPRPCPLNPDNIPLKPYRNSGEFNAGYVNKRDKVTNEFIDKHSEEYLRKIIPANGRIPLNMLELS